MYALLLFLLTPTWTLTADLDGDGQAEALAVYHQGGAQRGDDRGFLTMGDRTSGLYRLWRAEVADLDEDGQAEVVLGVWSETPRHAEPEPHRTVWVVGLNGGAFVERWRGSALGRPLNDFRLLPTHPPTLLALERDGEGGMVTAYRWNGFGFGGFARCPVPPSLAFTEVGPDRVTLDTAPPSKALTLILNGRTLAPQAP